MLEVVKMKLYSENKNYKLYNGNMLDMLEVIEPNLEALERKSLNRPT